MLCLGMQTYTQANNSHTYKTGRVQCCVQDLTAAVVCHCVRFWIFKVSLKSQDNLQHVPQLLFSVRISWWISHPQTPPVTVVSKALTYEYRLFHATDLIPPVPVQQNLWVLIKNTAEFSLCALVYSARARRPHSKQAKQRLELRLLLDCHGHGFLQQTMFISSLLFVWSS